MGRADPVGRALAQTMFPREWAAAEALTGKKRQSRMASLRRRAKVAVETRKLREMGASCSSCASWVKLGDTRICELMSDFYGYVRTQPDGLCAEWTAKP